MLSRGRAITGEYPYQFIDAGALGYGQVAINVLVLMVRILGRRDYRSHRTGNLYEPIRPISEFENCDVYSLATLYLVAEE